MDLRNVLENPLAYDHTVERVEVITTAVSHVFLTGDFAYKINKPRNLGFLDFSTLEKRKDQCEKEFKYNRLISPDLYLGVVAITQDGKVNGEGEVVEYAVKMRQKDPNAILSNKLAVGEVQESQIKEIAKSIFNFHEIAPNDDEVKKFGSLETVKFNWNENFEQTVEYQEKAIGKTDFEVIKERIENFIEKNESLFEQRIAKDKIKHCHGDFHSENIFVNPVTIFDGIVFNKRFPCSDVIAEVAFLAMDLDFHKREDLAKVFVSEYQLLSNDEDIAKLLDFYKCYRAYIRAKIACFAEEFEKAKKYFSLAKDYASLL